MDFYEYLRSQFSDINTCKKWYRKWAEEWDQEISDHPEYGLISMRAMAAHCSNVLEGKTKDYDVGHPFLTNYTITKYGYEIFLG